VLDPQGETSQRIADILGEVLDFDVNDSGTAVFFSASQGEGGSAIYRWDRTTGQAGLQLECPQALCRAAQVSSEGDLLAYERTPLSEDESERIPQVWLLSLHEINRPGSGADQKSPAEPRLAGDPDHQTEQPSWSPTGLLIFYDATSTAYILLDPKTGEATSFPSQTGMPGSWDPSGEHFVIPEISDNEIQGSQEAKDLQPIPSSHLLRYERKEGVLEDLTQADDLDDSIPAYSPKGGRLAFARRYLDLARWTPGRQLWIMQPDGSNAQPLTDDPFYNHYDFAWNPEGEELAYVRFNQDLMTEPPEIWLIRADGTLARQLIIGGYAPQWMP
jgi:Tol biopolymer transport system component